MGILHKHNNTQYTFSTIMKLLYSVALFALANAASYTQNKQAASSFLKAKADEYLKDWSQQEVDQASKLATDLGLDSIATWAKYKEGVTSEDQRESLDTDDSPYPEADSEVLEECVSECYWRDWRADWKGNNYEERLEAFNGNPDGPMKKVKDP